jgi:copper chaperone
MTAPTTDSTRTVLRAEGFSCPSCVGKIEKQLGRIDGVHAVTVRFASARIEVDHDPALATVDDLVSAIAKAGYTARPDVY